MQNSILCILITFKLSFQIIFVLIVLNSFSIHMSKVLTDVCKNASMYNISMNECFNNKLYCSSKLCREMVIRVVALKLNERQTQNMFNMLSKALKHI